MSKIQLFCIPYAGGSASAFSELAKLIDNEADVQLVEFPGHGDRKNEPCSESFDELMLDVKRQVATKRDTSVPYALLGYSMGSSIAFDLAQYLMEEKPCHVFFCAREAICYHTKGHDYALACEEEFAEKIIAFGGIDKRIAENKRFLSIYIKPVYADYKLLREYSHKPEKGVLSSDITVLYCEHDTPFSKVSEWSNYTSGKTDFRELGDNHFFIQKHAKEMADIINSKLKLYQGKSL